MLVLGWSITGYPETMVAHGQYRDSSYNYDTGLLYIRVSYIIQYCD